MSRITTLLLLAAACVGCRSAGHLPVAREFGALRDAYGEPAELRAVLQEHGPGPWQLLVGGADQLEALLAAAGAPPEDAPYAATVVDLSLLPSLERGAAEARALEAALELEGALLLDGVGDDVRTLRGTSRDITVVVLSPGFSIIASGALGEVRP
jgi:hypothetical protein